MITAAIDCGTNSTRLLVVDPARGALERRLETTRLGAGVDRTGRLSADAIARTLGVLRRYRNLIDAHGVDRSRAVLTSAGRDASNRDELLDPAEEILGVRPELLSGAEEAGLSFAGATSELDPASGPYLVVDIGGGSTEFALGSSACEGALSIDVGSVRLTEQYIQSDPPAPEELSNAIGAVSDHLDDVLRELPEITTARRMVGTAGTITTVAAVEIGLPIYDRDATHHFVLTRAAAEDVFRTLATERRADRAHNPGLPEGRVDIIVGGCCILVGIMRRLELDECLVSEADLLEGIIASLR